jgi:hypothetical protein
VKRHVIRTCLALALVAGSSLVTAGGATAAAGPGRDSAAACPGKGTRFVTGSGPEVYLVGPSHNPGVARLYRVLDPAGYFALWASWDGIATLPGVLNCWSASYPLLDVHLVKAPGNPAVYIWDVNEGFRWIVNWETFTNKYHFDPAKIGSASQGLIDSGRGPDWT